MFPGAVPYIFTGLRIAMPYSIGGAVIAELISSNRGLGYLIQLGAMNFDTTGVFVALVATTCIVFLGNWSVDAAGAAAAALAAGRGHHGCRRGLSHERRCSRSAISPSASRRATVAIRRPG